MTRPEGGDRPGLPVPDDYGDVGEPFAFYRAGDKPGDQRAAEPRGGWWTETPARPDRDAPDVVHEFRDGEQVRSTRGVGGVLGGAVPAGTVGRVVSVEHRLLDVRVTVEFANGYTETVAPDAIRYESGWF